MSKNNKNDKPYFYINSYRPETKLRDPSLRSGRQ